MGRASQLRNAHEKTIGLNPITVTLLRTEKVREGGGFRDETTALGVVTGRLYQETTGQSATREEATVAGLTETDYRWGLLLPDEMLGADGVTTIAVDLREGPNVTDWFLHPRHGRFEVRDVKPRETAGEVYGWAATLEQKK